MTTSSTPPRYIVRKAYGLRGYQEVHCGWDLLVEKRPGCTPAWCNRFALRREAIAARDEAMRQDARDEAVRQDART